MNDLNGKLQAFQFRIAWKTEVLRRNSECDEISNMHVSMMLRESKMQRHQ